MPDPLLTIDVGNTNVTLGTFDGPRLLGMASLSLEHTISLPERMVCALADLSDRPPGVMAVASVNPRIMLVVQAWGEDMLQVPVLRVRQDLPVDMPVLLDRPERLGDDRLMNGVAAYHRARGAVIVVDFGTASTVEAVSDKGEYLGGAIGPGVSLSAIALRNATALLPEITPAPTDSALGTNTQQAMQAGIFFGQVGMAREIIARLAAELGGRPAVYATGGDAECIAAHVPAIDEVVPALTLEGIALTYAASRS